MMSKIIRVFPRKTKWTPDDELCYFGPPPLMFGPPDYPVMISVVFTWDVPDAEMLYKMWSASYSDVQIGGPAFGDPGGKFINGRFIKKEVTFTSRGCCRRCPWCYVPKREGNIRELEINHGTVIQDNNLLACSKKHIESVFNMLREQNKAASFKGGLDIRLLKQWHIDLFRSIKVKDLWFAADSDAGLRSLIRAADLLSDFSPSKKRCYTMIGFDGECIYDAEARLETVFELGFFPYCQLYQGDEKKEYPKAWRDLARKWARPAIYNSKERRERRDNATAQMPPTTIR